MNDAHVDGGIIARDFVKWNPILTVEKYDIEQVEYAARKSGLVVPTSVEFAALGLEPYETVVSVGNLLTTAGLGRITSLIIGGGGQAATNLAARLGVGNSATAENVSQTDLQAAAGAGNRWFQTMDATFPTQSGGLLTFKSTVGAADGNFAWAEWGVDIGAPTVTTGTTVNATLLNRKVQALGTKTSAGSWVLTATITLS